MDPPLCHAGPQEAYRSGARLGGASTGAEGGFGGCTTGGCTTGGGVSTGFGVDVGWGAAGCFGFTPDGGAWREFRLSRVTLGPRAGVSPLAGGLVGRFSSPRGDQSFDGAASRGSGVAGRGVGVGRVNTR